MERIGGAACEGRTSAPLSMSAGSAVRAASLAYSPGSWHLDGPAGITVAVCLGLGWVSSVRRVMSTLSMYS